MNRMTLDNSNASIGVQEQQFRKSLERLVNRLNDNFSAFMKNIKCQGVVELVNPDNFSTIGLNIKVSFRDGMEVQSLNGQVQSGGVGVWIVGKS